jgi:tRNA A-37 threonylcarbamoyl transferase component Bud32
MRTLKWEIHPDYAFLEPFLTGLPETFAHSGEVIYKVRNEIRVVTAEGVCLNIKRFRTPIAINRFAYTYLRPSKAKRSYGNALRLLEDGCGTPPPVGYLEHYRNGFLYDSYYVCLHLKDVRCFNEFSNGSDIAGREDILEAFGYFLAGIHSKGMLHNDLSGGNVLFRKTDEGISFWLIDLNRMKFQSIDRNAGCNDMERLRGNVDFFRVMTAAYAKQRGYDAESLFQGVLRTTARSEAHFARKRRWKRVFRRKRK